VRRLKWCCCRPRECEKLGRGLNRSFPAAFWGNMALPAPSFWTSCPRS
jgi:hypothetical protein